MCVTKRRITDWKRPEPGCATLPLRAMQPTLYLACKQAAWTVLRRCREREWKKGERRARPLTSTRRNEVVSKSSGVSSCIFYGPPIPVTGSKARVSAQRGRVRYWTTNTKIKRANRNHKTASRRNIHNGNKLHDPNTAAHGSHFQAAVSTSEQLHPQRRDPIFLAPDLHPVVSQYEVLPAEGLDTSQCGVQGLSLGSCEVHTLDMVMSATMIWSIFLRCECYKR